jgi:hypothetical protein
MLTSRRLLLLLVAAVLVTGGAWWLASYRDSPRQQAAKQKVLPELKEHLNDVNEVRLVTAGDVTVVTLRRMDDKRWGVMERGGYSADRQKLSRLLMNLGDLQAIEEKTATPANYARLGVEDVKNEKATGVRIDLAGLGKPMSLVVGTVAGTRGSYVRPAASATSLLAEPQLTVERQPANWLDRRVLDIPMDRVQEVRVKAPKSSYTATREKPGQADFTVSPLPKGQELSSPSAANTVAGALGNLTFDDVSSLAATTLPVGEHSETVYRLFDGTIVTVNGTKVEDDHWLTLAVAFDETQHQRFAATVATPPETRSADQATPASGPSAAATATPATQPRTAAQVKQESEATAQRLDGWLFKIPAYKYETLFQPLDDMLKTP